MFFIILPAITFLLLFFLEKKLPTIIQLHAYTAWDHFLNSVGLLIQGCVVPAFGYWLSYSILPLIFPAYSGSLILGWWGSFLFNMVFIDFLYYWQHRAFHHFHFFWNFHQCHHSSSRVDIWTTSRNSILINFLLVYCLANPIFGFLCDSPDGFYAGAMVTASLDVFRHSRLDIHKLLSPNLVHVLSHVFLMPCQHHHHHRLSKDSVNLGANFIIWDILFGTSQIDQFYPESYGVAEEKHPLKQLLYPLIKK